MIMFHTKKGWGNLKFIQFYFEHREEILAHDNLEILGKNNKTINRNKELKKIYL